MTPLTDDELLELLETAEDVDGPIVYSNNVVPFLTRYNITAGEDKVPFRILYKLYKAYNADHYGPKKFMFFLHDIVVQEGRVDKPYYMLNVNAMKISKELYNLTAAKKITGVESIKKVRHLTNFIERYDLKRGKSWIEGYILYDLYKDKFRERKSKPVLAERTFTRILKLYFEHKKGRTGGTWYGLDKSYEEFISSEKIEKLRKSREAQRRNKKTQKRKGE